MCNSILDYQESKKIIKIRSLIGKKIYKLFNTDFKYNKFIYIKQALFLTLFEQNFKASIASLQI